MTASNTPQNERPAVGLRILAVVLAVLPFGWMTGVTNADLELSEAPVEAPSVLAQDLTDFEVDDLALLTELADQ